MHKPLVSIISVNYNQAEVTEEMIKSVEKMHFSDYELILVDNGSEGSLQSFLGERYPWVRVIETGKNLGFSGGNNVGIKASRGEYLFFINNDTLIIDECLETLVNFFKENPQVGLASPLILYDEKKPNGNDIIQYAGMSFLHPITGRNKKIGLLEENLGQYNQAKKTGYAHGAAMMMPRSVYDKVGAMPMQYFLYYEEMDWSQQVWNAGYEVWVVPTAKIYHKESVSTASISTLKTYFINRNRVLFMRRNVSKLNLMLFYCYYFFVAVPKIMLKYLITGQSDQLIPLWASIKWNFLNSTDYPLEKLWQKSVEA